MCVPILKGFHNLIFWESIMRGSRHTRDRKHRSKIRSRSIHSICLFCTWPFWTRTTKYVFSLPLSLFPLHLSPFSGPQVIIHYLWQCQTFTPNSILSDFTSQWWREQRQTGSFIMAGRLSLLTQTPRAGRSNHHQWLRGNFPWGAGQNMALTVNA